MTPKINILNLTRIELGQRLNELSPTQRDHVFRHVYNGQKNDLGKKATDVWKSACELPRFTRWKSHESEDGSHKLQLYSGNASFESVYMPLHNRTTLCVSSQSGCTLDCDFCVTGTLPLKKNLEAWEIVSQVLLANSLFEKEVSNVVFMGMGEPFHNFENIKKAVDILSDDWGLHIPRRKITVSTAGVIPGIEKWGEEGRTHLAISLVSLIDKKRTDLMPINRKYPLDDLLKAMNNYCKQTRQKVLCEYVLIEGLTDGDEDIHAIVNKLSGLDIKLNLIPYNENFLKPYKRPSNEKVAWFQNELHKLGMFSTIRWSYGSDVQAACGSLLGEGHSFF